VSEPEDWVSLLGSTDPEARYRAMERYTHACSDTRWTGELEPEFKAVAEGVRASAFRELLASDPAVPLANRRMAMYCWWLTYRNEDAPDLVRLLTDPDSDYLTDPGLAGHTQRVASRALLGDRGLDGGMLDVLYRHAVAPGLAPYTRSRLLVTLGFSAHEKVVPWLLAALDDPDDVVSGGAAQGLLVHDKERFRSIVLGDPRADEWRGGLWTVHVDED